MKKGQVVKKCFCYIFVLMAVLLSFQSCATTPQTTEFDTYSVIFQAQGLSSDEIYIRANMWFVTAFYRADSVIQFSNKEAGIIMGRFTRSANVGSASGFIRSLVQVEIMDNRFRVSFSDPTWNQRTHRDRPISNRNARNMLEANYNVWIALAESLRDYVNSREHNW